MSCVPIDMLPTQCPLLPTQGPLLPTQGPLLPTQGPLLPTRSIAPYSLRREIRWSLLHFGTFIHGFALRNVFTHGRVWHHIPLNIQFNSRLAHFNALWMDIRSLRTGIMEYPVMSLRTALTFNRTNIWRDKSNIPNMQSGGGSRGLELRTAALDAWPMKRTCVLKSDQTLTSSNWMNSVWSYTKEYCAICQLRLPQNLQTGSDHMIS